MKERKKGRKKERKNNNNKRQPKLKVLQNNQSPDTKVLFLS